MWRALEASSSEPTCAPRVTRGNGQMTIADYVQAGRYAAGLDSPAPAANGPGAPIDPVAQLVENDVSTNSPEVVQQIRTFRIANASIVAGQNGTVTLEYIAQGDENAGGFSLNFDTTKLTFQGVALGLGAPRRRTHI